MSVTISVLLPSRGRPDVLLSSVKSLIDTADNPEQIELLIGIDSDDEATKDMISNTLSPYLEHKKVKCRASIFGPLGYENLHQYINTLAGGAGGAWLFLWNDDCVMQTVGWDTEIVDDHHGEFKLLSVNSVGEDTPYAVLPIIPKDWYILLEHVSQHSQSCAWLSQLAYMLDIFEPVDIDVLHNRADLTGLNDDTTYQNRVIHENDTTSAKDFGNPAMQQARVKSAYKLAWFMERIGQRSQHWYDVIEGNQDPFEKMVFNDGTKINPPTPASSAQTAEDAAKTGQKKPRIADSEKISL